MKALDATALEAQDAPTLVCRTPRKDAARNHALLLDAAREVFAERGLDASLDDIARRAGLGIGTAYRHFANKQQVAEALFTEAIAIIVADAEHALTVEDPWDALVEFFTSAAGRQAGDRGLCQVLVGTYALEQAGRIREQLSGPVTELFDRAKRTGVLRADVAPNDSGIIFAMLGVVYGMGGPSSPELWRRYLTVILDGLRATERPALPTPPLTEAEMDRAMASAASSRL